MPPTVLDTVAVYADPPRDLAELPRGAIQLAPTRPGANALESLAEGSLGRLVVLAPHNTVERRCVLALALRALAPGGELTAMAPKDKGGARIARELAAFGCTVTETSKRHHRICVTRRPANPEGLQVAILDGALRLHEGTGLWTQPGLFSWDRVDPASALLIDTLPELAGSGADFGCGIGILARDVLDSPSITALTLIDIDRRAIEASRRNVDDARATFAWDDVRSMNFAPASLDFVVMNPPFHDGGGEDKALGQAFIARAADMLKRGGALWVTANRHLPYEAALSAEFVSATLRAERDGYKVYEAVR